MTSETEQNIGQGDCNDVPHAPPFSLAPRWLIVRRAIEEHRDGRRPPVTMTNANAASTNEH